MSLGASEHLLSEERRPLARSGRHHGVRGHADSRIRASSTIPAILHSSSSNSGKKQTRQAGGNTRITLRFQCNCTLACTKTGSTTRRGRMMSSRKVEQSLKLTLSLKLAGNVCDSRHPRPQMTVPAAMFEDDRHTGFELHFIGEPKLSQYWLLLLLFLSYQV